MARDFVWLAVIQTPWGRYKLDIVLNRGPILVISIDVRDIIVSVIVFSPSNSYLASRQTSRLLDRQDNLVCVARVDRYR